MKMLRVSSLIHEALLELVMYKAESLIDEKQRNCRFRALPNRGAWVDPDLVACGGKSRWQTIDAWQTTADK